MNIELLKAKIDTFFSQVSPEFLVEEFEKMGYSFIETDIPWSVMPQYKASVCETSEPPPFWKRMFTKEKHEKCKNKVTSEYPGSFFCLKLQYGK